MLLLVYDKHRFTAERLCGHLGVLVVTGHCFLGGYLGDHSGWVQCMPEKIWIFIHMHLLSLLKLLTRGPKLLMLL